ncbi:MAG TPA: hypothetical protein DDZ89_21140, partial [Clostridiales bacterium]|nr:hypothetical protein [Clostridiales bacterium]
MIEAGIFESDTTQVFVDIVKNTWNEITVIPVVNQVVDSTDTIQPATIHVTYEINTAGDLLTINGYGILPSGKPAIKENYTYSTLLNEKTQDA